MEHQRPPRLGPGVETGPPVGDGSNEPPRKLESVRVLGLPLLNISVPDIGVRPDTGPGIPSLLLI